MFLSYKAMWRPTSETTYTDRQEIVILYPSPKTFVSRGVCVCVKMHESSVKFHDHLVVIRLPLLVSIPLPADSAGSVDTLRA